MANTGKILVVMHIYYSDQLDLLLGCLKNIHKDYDLYVTLSNPDSEIIDKIKQFKSDTNIIIVENVGYDIWPFIKVINSVDLSGYDYVIKLHTKRDLEGVFRHPLGNGYFIHEGSDWRDSLLAFIKTPENLDKCFAMLENPRVGMCSRYNMIHNKPNHCGVIDEADKNYPGYISKRPNYCFVAGTMFVSKIAPIQLIKDMNLTADKFNGATTNHTTQLAHVIERAIGQAVYKSGMRIVDPFTSSKYVKNIRKRYRKYGVNKFLIRLLSCCIFIPQYRRRVRSGLMESRLYFLGIDNLVEEDSRVLKD